MAYRSDFYIPENIIGYTGTIDNKPTVYFLKVDGTQKSYGHITQRHDVGHNVGREKVTTSQNYQYGNITYQGDFALVEYDPDNNFFHKSRSILIYASTLKSAGKYKLSLAISNFPLKKQWSDLSESDQDKILDGDWGKKNQQLSQALLAKKAVFEQA